jgi:nucleoid-associated protein YgaU
MFVRLLVILAVAAFAVGAVVRSSNGAGRPQVYVVQPTDTLWSIAAHRYGGDPREGVWKLEQANELTGGATLTPGQKLLLP